MISLRKQLRTLANIKIVLIQLTSFFFLAGHLTLYAYLTPFLQSTLGLEGNAISLMYLLFGIAAIIGGGVGGILTDRIGPKKTIVSVISVFIISITSIPFVTSILPIFIIVMMVWSMLSWAITPAMQSYLITTSPDTSDIQQSLNNSALHFGIAFGSMIGGVVIEQAYVELNALVGGALATVSLLIIIISMRLKIKNTKMSSKAA